VTFDELERLLAAAPSAQGVLTVRTERGQRTYALGPSTHLDGELPVLDWRTAPLAGAFFRHGPGESYEIETGERTTDGTVVERWLITGRGEGLLGDDRIVTRDGEPQFLTADNVIPTLPFAPNRGMEEGVRSRVPEVYSIGDCDSPATIPEATAAGWRVGSVL